MSPVLCGSGMGLALSMSCKPLSIAHCFAASLAAYAANAVMTGGEKGQQAAWGAEVAM